jgi:hypothetical protein
MIDGGVVVRRNTGAMRPTGLAGAVMIAMYTAVSLVTVTTAAHMTIGYRRVNRIRAAGSATAADLRWAHDFDRLSLRLVITTVVMMFVAAVATAFWSRRVAQNSITAGDVTTSVATATYAWFIPLVWYVSGFSQLRRAPRADWPVTAWQLAFVTPVVAARWVMSTAFRYSELSDQTLNGGVSRTTLFREVRSEWILSLMFAGGFTLATLMAMRAVVVLRAVFLEMTQVSAEMAG